MGADVILVLSDLWLPFPGGAERLMFNLARDLMRRGEVIHVTTGYHAAQRFDGPWFNVIEVPENDVGAGTLQEAIDRIQPDVILTHHYWALTFENVIAGCARRHSAPIVQVVLNGRRMESATLAVYISDFVRTTLGGAREGDLTITPPAFPDVVAAEHGDAIGFIKPLPHKGVELVYEIARAMPGRQFVILRGEWQDIEIIEPLANVEFMEPVVDIRDFYERCYIVLMPSLSEDAGTVAQECALNGIPCISSDRGGLAETNAGGLRLPPTDLRQWVNEIDALDDKGRYQFVIDSQRDHTPTTQTNLLDAFADRVHELAR